MRTLRLGPLEIGVLIRVRKPVKFEQYLIRFGEVDMTGDIFVAPPEGKYTIADLHTSDLHILSDGVQISDKKLEEFKRAANIGDIS